MKSIKPLLLFCGGLMAIATLVGAIDYQQASKSGKLINLYKDDDAPLTAIPILNREQPPVPPGLNSFSRAPFPGQVYEEKDYAAMRDSIFKINLEKNKLFKQKQAKRKSASNRVTSLRVPPIINLGSFSRAPLRERTHIEFKH